VSELELMPERREELARDFEAVHDPLLTPATDDP